jgi:hypothetical protein
MFYTHVASVCVSNVSSASDVCCIQVFHVCKCFVFQRGMFRESWGTDQALEKGRGKPGADLRMGRAARLGSYGRGMLILIPALGSHPHGERRDQGEGAAGTGQAQTNGGGVRVRGRRGRQRRAAVKR